MVGIVLLDLDQHVLTARCLRSLADGSRRPDLVVLVENGSEQFDASRESPVVELPIVVLRPGHNLGCAGGRNLGLNYLARNTPVTTFIVLDNDTVVASDFVERVACSVPAPLEVIAPLIYDYATGEVWSSGGSTEADGTVHQLTEVLPSDKGEHEVDWAPGACLIMTRDTWARVGGFDSWMAFLFEDIAWCQRVRDLGGRIVVYPQLRLLHDANQSLGGQWSPERVHLWARNGTVFRAIVARAGVRSTAKWLGNESLLAVRDLATGKAPWALARLSGLALGLLEAIRRWSTTSRGN